MLRVYSILYLEQVWSRPSEKERKQVSSSSIEELAEDESSPCSDGTFTIDSQEEIQSELNCRPISCQSSLSDQTNTNTTYVSETPFFRNGENIVFDPPGANDDSSLSDVSVTEYIVHPTEEKGDKIEVVLEEVAEDEDEEEEVDNKEETKIKISVVEMPDVPAKSLGFSPKRILHRAKSSITDESVKILARRKSFFLEKFNHNSSNNQNTADATPEERSPQSFQFPTPSPQLKSLRRQSSRLTLKGKNLTKKLKRALSFHQDSPLHHS